MRSRRPDASWASAVTVELGRPSPTVSRVTWGRWAAASRGPARAKASAASASRARSECRRAGLPAGAPRCRITRARCLLHEGDLVDLAQRGDAGEHLLERGVAQERHALLARGLLDL